MSGSSNRVFVSCVSDEFEKPTATFPGLRGRLRQYLSRAQFDARVQEDFPPTVADTVLKVGRFIHDCRDVIHIVGAQPGAVAHPKAVAEFLAAEPNFLETFPELRAELGDCSGLTY